MEILETTRYGCPECGCPIFITEGGFIKGDDDVVVFRDTNRYTCKRCDHVVEVFDTLIDLHNKQAS